MSLKTVLVSLIVAGVLAGLVLLSSRGNGPRNDLDAGQLYRLLGFDAAGIVEIRVTGDGIGTQVATRTPGTVDQWRLQLDADSTDRWRASPVRVRSVLRALATTNVQIDEDLEIKTQTGTLTLESSDGSSVEVHFGNESAGGYVRIETVVRGGDGIATGRWFGRMKRSLRDSLVGDGIESWRSKELFDFPMSQVVWVEVAAGDQSVELQRTSRGWGIVRPWVAQADPDSVSAMLGLTLGLVAERFFDEQYTDDLTGLESPIARIGIRGHGSDAATTIELGSAVDSTGDEIFARYTLDGKQSIIVAIKTKGLGGLTPSPLGYVHQSASTLGRVDVAGLEFFANDGGRRMAFESVLGGWEDDGAAITPSRAEAVERLLRVLTSERANTILVLGNDDEYEATEIGEIAVLHKGAQEAERFGVGIESVEGAIRLHLWRRIDDQTRLVWVCSSAEATGSGVWLAALSSQEGEDGENRQDVD